jgi:hypothetical protein
MFQVLFAPIIRSTTAAYSHRFVCVENGGFSIKWWGGFFGRDWGVLVLQPTHKFIPKKKTSTPLDTIISVFHRYEYKPMAVVFLMMGANSTRNM